MVGNERAGVDSRAARNVEQPRMPAEIYFFRERLAEVDAAAVHRGGELRGEVLAFLESSPFLLVLMAGQVGRFVGSENVEDVFGDRAVLDGAVVRSEIPRRRADEVFASGWCQRKIPVTVLQQAHGGEQSE